MLPFVSCPLFVSVTENGRQKGTGESRASRHKGRNPTPGMLSKVWESQDVVSYATGLRLESNAVELCIYIFVTSYFCTTIFILKPKLPVTLQIKINNKISCSLQDLTALFGYCCGSFSKKIAMYFGAFFGNDLWEYVKPAKVDAIFFNFRIIVGSLNSPSGILRAKTKPCIFKPAHLDSFLQLSGMQQPASHCLV